MACDLFVVTTTTIDFFLSRTETNWHHRLVIDRPIHFVYIYTVYSVSLTRGETHTEFIGRIWQSSSLLGWIWDPIWLRGDPTTSHLSLCGRKICKESLGDKFLESPKFESALRYTTYTANCIHCTVHCFHHLYDWVCVILPWLACCKTIVIKEPWSTRIGLLLPESL